jgi:hypothetical protein
MSIPDHPNCLRCRRSLKNPESRLIGYGKVCASKVRLQNFNDMLTSLKSQKLVKPQPNTLEAWL